MVHGYQAVASTAAIKFSHDFEENVYLSNLTPGIRHSKTLIISKNVDKNRQKQSFRLPCVAGLATNGNRKHCF